MSGTLDKIYNSTLLALNINSREIFRLQEQVASGSRLNRPSDDPSAAYRVLNLSSSQRSLENYMENISQVSDVLQFATTAIDEMKTALADAKRLLGDVTGGVSGGVTLNVTIEGINDVIERIAAAANTQHSGKYIFGGSNTRTAPYLLTRENGIITSVTYQGSLQNRDITVSPGVNTSGFYVGEDLFRSNNRSEPVFTGQTGLSAGSGTSSVRGDVQMIVTHDGSNYRISIDAGLTETVVPVGGDSNLMVTDSRTGQVLYVNADPASMSTGNEWVQVPGTHDIFNTLINIRDKLQTEGGLTSSQMEELRSKAYQAIEEINTVLIQKSVEIGSKIGFLDSLKGNLQNVKYSTDDEKARIEEADIAQLAIDLARREVLYQMSLAVSSRLISMSILDYI
ncbi:MAG: flagellar hook-associated protein FlgL [Phycisphaerae bacterium]